MADRPQTAGPVAVLIALALALGATLPALADFTLGVTAEAVADAGGHLVISELETGGASASDEFVELYNPTIAAMPLEGLELIYVTSTGTTVTRKASWPLGAPTIPPGGHYLVTNDAGVYAAIGDATYASGVAATGGTWALRIQGAATAVDAIGWGTATAWLEARAAPAPAAGSSLERLPGGDAGSGQDGNDNLVDFAVRATPAPQNAATPPIVVASPTPSPSPSPLGTPTASETSSPTPFSTASSTPTASPTPVPTPTSTPVPTPTPTPVPMTIAEARALTDGARVTVRGVALTDHAFGDGGGYLADDTGGVAVLLSSGAFTRGTELLVTGTINDRYAQRTIRTDAAGVAALGAAAEPSAPFMATGGIGESVEGTLVEVAGTIVGSQTILSGGTAVQLDDGTGEVRVLVGDATAIDVTTWQSGASLRIRGVSGQRDSSGTATAGYRVQPRDPADVLAVSPPAAPTPTPSPLPTSSSSAAATPSPSGTVTATPSPSALPLMTVATARAAATNAKLRIRAVVTVPSGLVEAGSAVVQDASGGILVRLGADAGSLRRGELVELAGTRSTKSGMVSLRITMPPLRLGHAAEPRAIRTATGRAGERVEARLVVVRGVVSGRVARSSSGSVSFDLDDGSGPLHVVVSPRTGITAAGLAPGSWLEVRGALGQVTTGSQPLRGYRLWPRDRGDLVILAAATAGGSTHNGSSAGGSVSGGAVGVPGTGEGRDPSPSAGTEPSLGGPPAAHGSPTGTPALTMPRGAAGSSARPRGADAGLSRGAPTAPDDSRMPAGILLIGLAGLTAGGAAAWRTGLAGRLTGPPNGPAAPGEPDAGAHEGAPDDTDELPLTRLSVVGGADRGGS